MNTELTKLDTTTEPKNMDNEALWYSEKLSYVKPAFGSPGGKTAIVKTLLRYVPSHKIYAEPMVGGGALFFNKEAEDGKTEIINDLNPEIAFVYRFLQRITEEDIKKLRQYKSDGDKDYFECLLNKKPTNDIERFHRFIYLSHFSFGGNKRSFSPGKAELDLHYFYNRIPKIKERLKGVKIHNEDYLEILKRYDSIQTFFYLDPPYPGMSWPDSFGEIDLEKMCGALKHLKGNFLLSLNDKPTHRKIFTDFEIRGLTSAQYITFDGARRKELLIANYPLKPNTVKNDFLDNDLEKANYIGNKRRFAKYIAKKFPEDGKTIFDPMCGCSAVLIEATRNGYHATGNDLSIVPYWYSKGVFEGAAFSEADIEKLVNAKPQDGWLTTEWKGMYPRKREIRRYIDGLVLATRDFSGNKLHTARAIVSRLLQTMYSDSGSGYSTRNWETMPDVKRILSHAVKEVTSLIGEVGGKGKITNLDARKMTFPKSDVVYFDPPFFRKNKGHVLYFNSYKVSNSVLLQKEWKEDDLKKEEAVDILHRLCKSTGHIFVSSARNCEVPWAAEVSKFKKMVKKYKLTYRQTSGFPSGRDEEQRENLVFGKAMNSAYMRCPSEDYPPRYICQHHFRGKSLHADFRIELDNKSLIGWTLNSMIEGSINEPIITLDKAKNLKLSDYSKIDWATGEFAKRKVEGSDSPINVNLLCEMKEIEPHSWLTFEGVTKPGDVGATKEYPGVFLIVDRGICEYGAQRQDLHEYFPKSDRRNGGFNYRLIIRRMGSEAIEGKSEELIKETKDGWLLIKPVDQMPYVLSERALKDGWIPPQGFSAIPNDMRNRIPKEFRYWMRADEKERLEVRDALVLAIKEGKVSLTSKGVEECSQLALNVI